MIIKSDHIPRATLERMAVYLEVLNSLSRDGVTLISSEELGTFCNTNGAQVRKDLAYFGEFGVRGLGYYVEELSTAIASSLGINREWRAVLIGMSNMARSLLMHREMRMHTYRIVGVFDIDPAKVGEEIAGLKVQNIADLKNLASSLRPEIGIITSRPDHVQYIVNQLINAGVRGILNFTPTRVPVPEGVFMEYVDYLHHLYALSFNLSTAEQQGSSGSV